MFDRIETLKMADGLIAHGSQRQKLIATNVANADTPGFHARDLGKFAETYRSAPATRLRTQDERHVSGTNWGMGASRPKDAGGEPSPNGNTVAIEDEVFRLADARREFDLAISITKSSLSLIRASLGRKF
ncbi:FlgB family protein [Paracoccus aminophilus]|uniref:Flagellar basal-body rod protein, FlgB n=1 Tax=Paracoccus aminophilus JCM 7686 TaxID=1367847 RepID=S5XRT1_PARAH|nr:FlgB family protein [Paracoccus aminophilus]AGT10124.1 flagellar basal-body rod protein, FlgB [Paracoccus aminophilus JCM 7686]